MSKLRVWSRLTFIAIHLLAALIFAATGIWMAMVDRTAACGASATAVVDLGLKTGGLPGLACESNRNSGRKQETSCRKALKLGHS